MWLSGNTHRAKRWIEDKKDLEAMYKVFSRDNEITIWCEGRGPPDEPKSAGKKRKAEDSSGSSSKRIAREDEIEEIVQKLRERHSDRFSLPQMRLWARMKLNGQHDCLDNPPQIPLFTGRVSVPKRDSLSDALTNAATAVVSLLNKGNPTTGATISAMSPGKKAHVSGQYLDHLQKLRQIYDSGVLTKEFEEQNCLHCKMYVHSIQVVHKNFIIFITVST